MFYTEERLALFIDGPNIFAAAKFLGFEIDFGMLKREFARRGRLVRASYYTRILGANEFSALGPLVDLLDCNGFKTIMRIATTEAGTLGARKTKGSIDIDLAVDALETPCHVDHVLIFSGNGEFRRLVEALQKQGVRVTICSTIRGPKPIIADILRRQADAYIDLDDLRPLIAKATSGLKETETVDGGIEV